MKKQLKSKENFWNTFRKPSKVLIKTIQTESLTPSKQSIKEMTQSLVFSPVLNYGVQTWIFEAV